MRLYDEDAKLKRGYDEPRPDWQHRLADWLINTFNSLRWRYAALRSRLRR